MAKLMWIAGILLAAVGIALGLMVFFSTAQMVAWDVTLDTASVLLVGGLLALGLGGVINAVDVLGERYAAVDIVAAPAKAAATPIPEYGRRAAEAAGAAAAITEVSPEVKDTIDKIERAKQDLSKAFGDKPGVTGVSVTETVVASAPSEAAAEAAIEEIEEAIDEAQGGEDQLYVVEERTIRNRPARILSDGTVEAETDEGWMRFENLEHLDEYLEAMSPST